MSKIILEEGTGQTGDNHIEQKKENPVKPNLFLGRTEPGTTNATFPDWDIVPPDQFINPRIKKQ